MNEQSTITAKEFFESVLTAPVSDGHCRTCRDWDKAPQAEVYGMCLCDDNHVISTTAAGKVLYPRSFGCIFHSPKEAQ
jgi:hypothetical protein